MAGKLSVALLRFILISCLVIEAFAGDGKGVKDDTDLIKEKRDDGKEIFHKKEQSHKEGKERHLLSKEEQYQEGEMTSGGEHHAEEKQYRGGEYARGQEESSGSYDNYGEQRGFQPFEFVEWPLEELEVEDIDQASIREETFAAEDFGYEVQVAQRSVELFYEEGNDGEGQNREGYQTGAYKKAYVPEEYETGAYKEGQFPDGYRSGNYKEGQSDDGYQNGVKQGFAEKGGRGEEQKKRSGEEKKPEENSVGTDDLADVAEEESP